MMLAYLCDVFPNCKCAAAAAAFANSPRRVLRPGLHGQPRSTVCVVCVGVSVKGPNKTTQPDGSSLAIQSTSPPCASNDHKPSLHQ